MENPPEERKENDAVIYDFSVFLFEIYKKKKKTS